MDSRYLEITFRRGRPLAAYLYLVGSARTRSQRSEAIDQGLVLDYGPDGALIGIEITAPTTTGVDEVNAVLQRHQLPLLAVDELSPLKAA